MNAFNAETHTYSINGVTVPSVTQVLNDLIPGFQAGEWYLQRGTAIHACAAMIARGVAFEHDPQISGQVAACRRFFAEVKPFVMHVERSLFCSRAGFAGTFDMVANVCGKIMVVDWKASISNALPYQLGGYSLLLDENAGNSLKESGVAYSVRYGCGVQLNDDGTYKMTRVYDLRGYKNGFLALLSAYNIRRACKVNEEEMV